MKTYYATAFLADKFYADGPRLIATYDADDAATAARIYLDRFGGKYDAGTTITVRVLGDRGKFEMPDGTEITVSPA